MCVRVGRKPGIPSSGLVQNPDSFPSPDRTGRYCRSQVSVDTIAAPSSVVKARHTCLSELLPTDPPRMTIATTAAAAVIFAILAISASTGALILWMDLRLERSRAEAAERTRRAHIETLHKRLMRALRRLCKSIDFQEEDKSPLTSRASRPSVSVRGKDVHATVTREIDDA